MIYIFDKQTNEFIQELPSVDMVAKYLQTKPYIVQEVLDGLKESIKGIGLLYKPESQRPISDKISYHQAQKDKFFALSRELCTWEECVWLFKGDIQVARKTVKLNEGIKMLINDFTAIPF